MEMIDRIKEVQNRNGWNDIEFCRELDIDPSIWSRIKAGQRSIRNWAFMSAVGKRLPELQLHITRFLFEGGNHDTSR